MLSEHIAIVDKNYEARIGSGCRSTFMLELEVVTVATDQASEDRTGLEALFMYYARLYMQITMHSKSNYLLFLKCSLRAQTEAIFRV